MNSIRLISAIAAAVICVPLAAMSAFSADQAPQVKHASAKICTNCHKAEPNMLQGHFDSVAFKARTIQMKIDDSVELIRFDEDEIKVVNGDGKTGDGEFLKDNRVKKGHEIMVQFIEKEGVKTAVKLVEKPPVKIPAEMLMSTAELEKLVVQGPEKGKYFLFDSRPLLRFQEGAIPTAVNLPFPSFDKMIDRLPKDKGALLIFYCAGPTCTMSPGSANKAKKLGYTNIRVYRDGMPAWSGKNFGLLSALSLKEAWIDTNTPHVLLDVRSDKLAAKGFIKGAVSFPASRSARLIKALPSKEKNPPVIVYDSKDGKQAAKVARTLIKAGYGKVMLLDGGFAAWQAAKFETAGGKLAAKATYTPKPRPGEIDLNEFKKFAAGLPDNVMIIDVRNAEEGKAGMLKSARLIPADEIRDRLSEIPKDKLIVTYCTTGVRAEMAYHALKELGFSNVRFLNAKTNFEKNGGYTISKE